MPREIALIVQLQSSECVGGCWGIPSCGEQAVGKKMAWREGCFPGPFHIASANLKRKAMKAIGVHDCEDPRLAGVAAETAVLMPYVQDKAFIGEACWH